MEGTLATIMIFAGNFQPRGWTFCAGQLLSIAEYTAVFSLVGTTYGGDGQTTFGVPDLRGRVPIGTGQGNGLSNVILGELAGNDSVTLNSQQLPQHFHFYSQFSLQATTANHDGKSNSTNALATTANPTYAPVNTNDGTLGGVQVTINPAGNSNPLDITQPYLVINYVFCLEGIFPSRN